MVQKSQLDSNKIPVHIAIIMDGNGRWAKKAGEQRTFGHQSGVESVRDTVEAATALGVQYLTLYAFSTENWNRPSFEVEALMEILVNSLIQEKETFMKNGIKLSVIGDDQKLPESCRETLYKVIEETSGNSNLTLNLALSYSGRWDLTNAVKNLVKDVQKGLVSEEQIDQDLISSYLSTKHMPDPDLMIRTSGEFRISNFLLWQLAYTEIYITDTLWPDFRAHHLYEAILNFQNRERRFGKTGEQIKAEKAS